MRQNAGPGRDASLLEGILRNRVSEVDQSRSFERGVVRHVLRIAACAILVMFATASRAQMAVQLVDAGSDPREMLRYRVEPGRSEHATIEQRIQLALYADGKPLASPTPSVIAIRLRINLHLDGGRRVRLEVESAEAPDSEARLAAAGRDIDAGAFTAALAANSLKGKSGAYAFDARGWTVADKAPALVGPDGQITYSDLDAGYVARVLSAMTVPFPIEPMGVGARWRVTRPNGSADAKMTRTTEYTLRSRSGNRIVVEVRDSGTAADAADALPTEKKIGSAVFRSTVNSARFDESGTAIIDLDRLVPTTWLEDVAQVEQTVVAGEQPAYRSSSSIGVRVSIAPVE